MDIIVSIIRGILEQGLIYGIMALGIYITYCILNFPDLSVDGTFPLGAAVTAILLSLGFNPWLALVAAFGWLRSHRRICYRFFPRQTSDYRSSFGYFNKYGTLLCQSDDRGRNRFAFY